MLNSFCSLVEFNKTTRGAQYNLTILSNYFGHFGYLIVHAHSKYSLHLSLDYHCSHLILNL